MWPGCETLMLARERGLLPADHVQIIEMTWASATMRAFESGVVDAVVLSLDEVMCLRETGRDLRVVLVMDASQGGDAVIVREGIASLGDLKGRRVGVDLRGAGMYLLTCALEQAGLKSSDLGLVSLNLPETADAFINKEVDAVVSGEPWITKLRAAGGRSLFDSSQANTPVYRVLVVSSVALRDQRDDVLKVVRAHFAMMKELRKGGEVAGMQAILRRQALTREEFLSCWNLLKSFDLKENLALIGDQSEGLRKDTASMELKMRSNALLNSPASTKEWIDGSLLKEVEP